MLSLRQICTMAAIWYIYNSESSVNRYCSVIRNYSKKSWLVSGGGGGADRFSNLPSPKLIGSKRSVIWTGSSSNTEEREAPKVARGVEQLCLVAVLWQGSRRDSCCVAPAAQTISLHHLDLQDYGFSFVAVSACLRYIYMTHYRSMLLQKQSK